MTVKPLEMDIVDWSELELYQPPTEGPRPRRKPILSLRSRCPKEIWMAKSLKIERAGPCYEMHNHNMVSVNGLELCPVSAIMFLVAAKNYRWSDGLKAAIDKVMEEAHEDQSNI